MVLDGPGFHVDLDAVDQAAQGIKQSMDDQENFELADLCGPAEMYGHGGVHASLMDFCERWSDGLDTLTEDAEAIGESLGSVSQAYRAIDENAARTLQGDPAQGAVDG